MWQPAAARIDAAAASTSASSTGHLLGSRKHSAPAPARAGTEACGGPARIQAGAQSEPDPVLRLSDTARFGEPWGARRTSDRGVAGLAHRARGPSAFKRTGPALAL